MNKNEIVELKIDGYGEGGEGVGRWDGMAVFVPFAMKDETVRAKIILAKKSYAIGKLEQILEKSPDRIEPKCGVFTKCGGCQLQHMNQSEQSNFKQSKVADCFSRIAFIDAVPNATVTGEHAWRYRNKLQLPLSDNNGLIGGFFAPYSHRIVEISDCEIQDENSMKIFHAVKEYADENNVKGYNEFNHKGLLRHLVTRTSLTGTLITLVINGNSLPKSSSLTEKLEKLQISYGLYINENPEQNNVVTGEKFTHIGGHKEIHTEENGFKFSIVPQSFLQVNEEIKEKLYQDAIEIAKITSKDIVVNAYSGAGLLTAYFAKTAKHAYGIEIVSEATESANQLAKRNGLSHKMTNITGDCKAEIRKLIPLLKENNSADDTSGKTIDGEIIFVLDPPRKGVDLEILQELLELMPDKIIYISCNPATLARDVGILTGTLSIAENGIVKTKQLAENPSNEKSLLDDKTDDEKALLDDKISCNFPAQTQTEFANTSEHDPSSKSPLAKYHVTAITPYDMFPQTKHVETLCCLSKNT